VSLLYPQRGEKVALVELANRNARTSFDKKQLAETAARDLLEQVRAKLGLSRLPIRIECYDISNLQGTRAVGAGVAFENAEPAKSRYRRYSIRSVEGQDDFAMMREVLTRRFTRAAAESPDLLPNLILIDGGKGQLNAARAALQDMNVNNIELASIA
jgi:excinuclease ABC subunit C